MYARGMAKKKKATDAHVIAHEILQALAGEPTHTTSVQKVSSKKKGPPAKNPAAVALGRLGGLKGGKARDKNLTAKEKSAIARKAAKTRWGKYRQANP